MVGDAVNDMQSGRSAGTGVVMHSFLQHYHYTLMYYGWQWMQEYADKYIASSYKLIATKSWVEGSADRF